MISAEKLTKQYDSVRAVHAVSFEVKEGETLVLLGTSGCGKTTTLRMMNRLIEPTSGSVWMNGRNVLQLSPEKLRRGIGYVLQNHGLFPHYTVAENIAIVPNLLQWDKEKINRRVEELMHKMQLPPQLYGKAFPHQLSGGQQQRVGLARALAAYPPVMLMDEPFGALDPITRQRIREEFGQLDELKKKTIVMVTHDVQEAFALGDKICLMHKGEVVQTGTPAALLFQPANDFVQHFFDQQRWILELNILSLHMLWELLPDEPPVSNTILPAVSAQKKAGDVLELLSQQNSKDEARIAVVHTEKNEQKNVSFVQLLAAVSQYKKRF